MKPETARTAGRIARALPAVLGCAFVCIGVGVIFWPAGLIAAGAALLLVDRQVVP